MLANPSRCWLPLHLPSLLGELALNCRAALQHRDGGKLQKVNSKEEA